jgi:hypothetical protein
VRVVFGSGDKVQFVEVNPATGAKKSIKIWNYASRFGNAMFDHASKIILIPGAAGFEAWTLQGDGEPRKTFDLVLADNDSYAVVLPNGFMRVLRAARSCCVSDRSKGVHSPYGGTAPLRS